MARGKNLNFKMKKYVSDKMRLDPNDWLYIKNTNEEFIMVNKVTGEKKIIDKIERNIAYF